ncbi:hypothetical protein, partial [Limosilactobacillus reuteri]|uniref:hypothetical protein n=1 Tax=Limosilactobacillus reuteri TaxID=1598 RepID=UPI001CDD1B3F
VLIGIHQSRSSCLIYVTKFVQVISCNLPLYSEWQIAGRRAHLEENPASYKELLFYLGFTD